MTHIARRCSAKRKDGLPCRAWARRDSDPALCASHRTAEAPQAEAPSEEARNTQAQNTEAPGEEAQNTQAQNIEAPNEEDGDFYATGYSSQELADLLVKDDKKGLKDELRATRVIVRRVLEQLKQELEPAEYARLIGLVFKGTHTIADILRAQREASNGGKDARPQWLEDALTDEARKRNTDL
jgi:hypothetical protein